LRFLDAYDFSSEGSEDIQEENKPLISASVLGLIFEKINGYKDGSFFTPSFITMYMCRETIGQAVIQKFNEVKNWNCHTINDLYNKIEDIAEANEIFNTIRICDPAVGSGHFLVSALNEMIYLKSELGILADKSGKRLKEYKISIENDELIISDKEGNFFNYNPGNYECQRVQETFFYEKQVIIENCLFGVDININSVKICQLRLWVELLKHTYYKPETEELETLPNIDINIKCGNSLISRFNLHGNYSALPLGTRQKLQKATRDYKAQVILYKCVSDKAAKELIRKNITQIKAIFSQINDPNDIDYRKWKEAENKYMTHTYSLRFDEDKEVWNKKLELLQTEMASLREKYEQKIKIYYSNAFEWSFEFPEILDDNGNFAGFDAIIGNPPYIQLQSMGSMTDAYKNMNYQVFERMGDIYCLFYELGNKLLKPNGHLSFITSNKWMRAGYGEKTRKLFIEQTCPIQLIDFAGVKVFDEATVDVNILMFSKDKNRQKTNACMVKKEGIKDLSVYFKQNAVECDLSTSDSWVILSPIEQRIKAKIEAVGTPLKDWDIQINYGIKTGYNEAFIISGEKRKELIEQDPKSEEIIRPLLRGRDIKRYGY
jgi:type II restriction/modification system DNA methylase subunit YeeA